MRGFTQGLVAVAACVMPATAANAATLTPGVVDAYQVNGGVLPQDYEFIWTSTATQASTYKVDVYETFLFQERLNPYTQKYLVSSTTYSVAAGEVFNNIFQVISPRFGGYTDSRSVEFIGLTGAVDITRVIGFGVGIAAIPEPATWALMLTGFAMAGYALRRRRASVAFA